MITERDEAMLAAIDNAGGLDLAALQLMFGLARTVAYRRMGRLEDYGMLEAVRPFLRCPAIYVPTRRGLREMLGREDLDPPSVSAGSYNHQLHVGRVIAEIEHHGGVRWQASRTTRRHQKAAEAAGDVLESKRYSIELSWLERSHLPDVLIWPSRTAEETSQPIAVEVELAQKSKSRLDEILLGYSVALDMAGVVYVCGPHSINAVERAVARLDDHARIAQVSSIYDFGPHWREPTPQGGRPRTRKTATETTTVNKPTGPEETWVPRNLTGDPISAVELAMRGPAKATPALPA